MGLAGDGQPGAAVLVPGVGGVGVQGERPLGMLSRGGSRGRDGFALLALL